MRHVFRASLLALSLLTLLLGIPVVVQGPSSVAATRRPPSGDPAPGKPGAPQPPARLEAVLIQASKPYTDVMAEIRRQGGTVTQQYKYFDGLAAQIPRSAMAAIEAIVGPDRINKDRIVDAPSPRDVVSQKSGAPPVIGDAGSTTAESAEVIAADDLPAFAAAHPEGYVINDAINNSSSLHAEGIIGSGVIVGVIDSGIRPGFPHISLDGSVIGGEDFVLDGLGFSNSGNNPHGTFVSGMISANVSFRFAVSSGFFRAVRAYAPGAVVGPTFCSGGPTPGALCTSSATCGGGGTCVGTIPMIGSAPLSSIYALRVFGASGGAPFSRILQAIDRAIELRDLYDSGMPGGVNIRVVNMSIGGPSLYPGREIFDLGVSALLDHDIVAVSSASNAGPSGLTIGSPGSSLGTLTVGAASLAHNERIVRDLQYGSGIGGFFRPFGGTQTVYFSSRGPNPDGRADPEVLANGDYCFGQGYGSTSSVSFGGGTSFSSPTVAGVAALLREAVPSATARQVHNAIVATANAGLLADGSTLQDQGAGYVDALAARNLLLTGTVPDALPAPPAFTHKVRDNVLNNAGLTVLTGPVTQHIGPLKPGERGEILYQVQPNTSQVLVSLSNVTPSLPPGQQNVFFGDDVLFTVHTAKTTKHTNDLGDGDYLTFDFCATSGGGTSCSGAGGAEDGDFVYLDPETGIMRVTVSGDWTNAGGVSADVSIASVTDPSPQFTKQGKVSQDDFIYVPIAIGPGVSTAEFRLTFREDWSNYPVSDIDLILLGPDASLNFDGATLADPERAVLHNPTPGVWTAIINGFEVHVPFDRVELRITLDGVVVH